MSRPLEPHDAGVGRELAVQHVEAGGLARAVGADQRQQLAGVDGEGDVGDRLHAAERLVQARRPAAPRVMRGSRQRASSALRPPTRPCGKTQHDQQDHQRRARRARTRCARASASRSQVKIAAPTTGPVSVSTPPSSTITSPSIDCGDRERRGRDAALGEGEERAGQAGERAGEHEGRPLEARARRCRSPRRAAANRGRRAARSRRARTARATGARCRRRRATSAR